MNPLSQTASRLAPGADRRLLGLLLVPSRMGDASVRERELALGGLALGCVGMAFIVAVPAGTLAHPVGFAALVAWSVVSFVAAGLLWWRARPWSPVGPLLCALGLVIGLHTFQASANGLAFGLGVLMDGPAVLLAWYLTVTFPGSQLDKAGKLVMALGCGVVLLAFLPELLLSTDISGATPLARCGPECPPNQLLLTSDPGLASVFQDIEQWGRVMITLLLVYLLVSRYRRASRPRRRTLLPVYAGLGLWLTAFAVYNFALNADASIELLDRIGLSVTITRSLFPLAFIAALVTTRAHAGGALQGMVRELRRDPSLGSVERTVRHVLDDPSARLGVWLPEARSYIDADGKPLELAAPDGEVSVSMFESTEGEPLVAIMHDRVLAEDPELVDAVGEATVLMLEHRSLDRQLRESREELLRSEQGLGAAVAEERKRIERDLHDGSQQRLVAIRIGLELARERAEGDPESRARLERLGEELDRALEELRGLAHGFYPSVLPDFGLRTALEEAAGRAGVPVASDLQEIPRYSARVETGLYFACVEALQNAAKHAGSGAHIELRLWTDGDRLVFSVSDDGAGFTPGGGAASSGLRNMADRLAALDGEFSLDSAPGQGTVATGSVRAEPLAAR